MSLKRVAFAVLALLLDMSEGLDRWHSLSPTGNTEEVLITAGCGPSSLEKVSLHLLMWKWLDEISDSVQTLHCQWWGALHVVVMMRGCSLS
ncbi:hypothetical protein HDK64DRAFT_275147 [Phyllosticta capitalensis]|uniref:Secreted protein n=1 Tax=Phyllosticta capitalensis TaxID=121624 RepID=A0ABR1YA82_9PEZI